MISSTQLQNRLHAETPTSFQLTQSASGFFLSCFSFIGESWRQALHFELSRDQEIKKRKFILKSQAQELLLCIVAKCDEALFDPSKSIPLRRTIDARCWKSLLMMPLSVEEKRHVLDSVLHRHMHTLHMLPKFLPVEQLSQAFQPAKEAIFRGWEVLLRECDFKMVERTIHLDDEELRFLQLSKDEPQPDLMRLDCSGYAMLKTREPRAIEWIKSCNPPEEFYVTNTLRFLRGWGYRVQDKPSHGSLVLYFNDALIPTLPDLMHTAVYLGDGLVKSKMGINNAVYEHRLENVPALYGSIVIFMSKDIV